jgi:hypothetical protein
MLNDVAVVSANDVWTVGDIVSSAGYSRTLAEHWNGTAWKAVPAPNHGPNGNYLRGVAAFSTSDVWAVGDYQSKTIPQRTLIEHWNGTAWQIVASPNAGSSDNYLFHVAGVAANDLWAVGYYVNSQSVYRTLIEHWNGTTWKVIASPNITGSDILNSVVAVSTSDVWSVGVSYNNSGPTQTLIEHWNGSNWQVVVSPNPFTIGNSLWGVAAVSANNVWAVGSGIDGNSAAHPLFEHWNGTTWQVVSGPTPAIKQIARASGKAGMMAKVIPFSGGEPLTFFGVTAVSANNVWTVGDYINSSGIYQTLIEHWNGQAWSIVSSPNFSGNSYLRSAANIAGTKQVWTVGYGNATAINTLTEFYC